MKKFGLILLVGMSLTQNAWARISTLDSERVPYTKFNMEANQASRDTNAKILSTTIENQKLLNQVNISLQKTNANLEKLLRSIQQINLSLNAQLVQQKKLYTLEKSLAEYQLSKDTPQSKKATKAAE